MVKTQVGQFDHLLSELRELLISAVESYCAEQCGADNPTVAQVAIYCDPAAATSSVCFETVRHLRDSPGTFLTIENDGVLTAVPLTYNQPGDFEFRDYRTRYHPWLAELVSADGGSAWEMWMPRLTPSLLKFRNWVLTSGIVWRLPTEGCLWIGCNSHLEWYDNVVQVRPPLIGPP